MNNFCSKCGKEINENEAFCSNCGSKIMPVNSINSEGSIKTDSIQNQTNQPNQQSINIQQNQFTQSINNEVYQSNGINYHQSQGNYKLTLNRKKSFVGCLIKFKVYIDGLEVAKIGNGEKIELNITGGNHNISINENNAVNIMIQGDTTADVVVFGANNFGITNISGQGYNNNNVPEQYLKNNKNKTFGVLGFSISLPIISFFFYLSGFFPQVFWFLYAIVIGCAIVNIFGLKKQKMSKDYKLNLSLNIISIIILSFFLIIFMYLTIK